MGIPASGKAGAQLPEFGAFAEGDDELSARDAAGRALAQAVTTPPSTPEKMRFGRRECRPFKPEFATSPGPRVAPHGKMDNSRKAPCKERTTFLAGARNPEIPRGGISLWESFRNQFEPLQKLP